MARTPKPVFLERQSYRRRRLGDAAKLLPFLGLVLFLLPILWAEGARTADGIIYLFTVWALLIGLVAYVSGYLAGTEPEKELPSDNPEAEP